MVVALVAACSKEEVVESPKFDAKVIAAEADKGNLGPLTELNKACSAEVGKSGKRLAVCKVQDDVRNLRKPMNIRF
jgi:ADP-dependent phosphofructokinase/glucokinase